MPPEWFVAGIELLADVATTEASDVLSDPSADGGTDGGDCGAIAPAAAFIRVCSDLPDLNTQIMPAAPTTTPMNPNPPRISR